MGKPFFEGWYFKHQWDGHTAAFIPAWHRGADGALSASLQLVTETGVAFLPIPPERFSVRRKPFEVRAGECLFTMEGCRIDCPLGSGRLTGTLRYTAPRLPKEDIMGPFRFVPGLPCRHSVLSLGHGVEGSLGLNGRELAVRGGSGYVEGDRGLSFPKWYVWTHCAFPGGSLMLSAAEVPVAGLRIPGCTGFVWLDGRELRLATYRGARVLRAGETGVTVRQGPWWLTAELVEGHPRPLRAPVEGDMSRTVRESPACTVRYRLTRNGRSVLDITSDRAGFESAGLCP